VDDEPAIARLLSAVFRRAGYVVRVASSGFEAMQVCECESFDALLSDVRMPCGINGHELVRWVATRYPNTHSVLMSGFDDTCWPLACTLLMKPFRPSNAVLLIDQLLEHSNVPPAVG